MKIQKYLLIEDSFDLYQINVRLEKSLVTLLPIDIMPPTISLLIPLIIISISLLSNRSINNLLPVISNSQILAS